jgi:hypothetical protein
VIRREGESVVANCIRGKVAVIAALVAGAVVTLRAHADPTPVEFPHAFAAGVRYATVERGNVKAEIFTSRATIDVVKQGGPFPVGT